MNEESSYNNLKINKKKEIEREKKVDKKYEIKLRSEVDCDKDKIYVPLTGYLLFSNKKRSEVYEKLVSESKYGNIGSGTVVKKLGKLWNNLSMEERLKYNKTAERLNREMKRLN